MMRKLSLLLATASLVACFEAKPKPEEALVVELVPVGERVATNPLARITLADYRGELARLRFEREETLYAKPLPPELKKYALEELIDRRLIAMEAKASGVTTSTAAVERELTAMKASFSTKEFQQLLVDTYQTENDLRNFLAERFTSMSLLEKEVYARVKVDEAEVKKAWDEKPATEKVHPERIHARQIVVRTEDDGKKVSQALAKKADFGQLAKEVSIAPESAKGGDLGWFARGQMPSIFDDLCFNLQPNQVSMLTPSEYGFHLCQLLEREGERPMAYEEARQALHDQLHADRLRVAQAEYLATLRSRVNVIKDEALIDAIDKEKP